MSYDFYAEVDTGGDEPHHIEPYFADTHPAFTGDGMAGNVMVTSTGYARCGNYTSNVSGIWAKCLTAALSDNPDAKEWVGAQLGSPGVLHLVDLQGVPMRDLVPLLRSAVEWGVTHIVELHEFDPPNGWGDAEGAVTYLWDIQRFCEQHPNATLYLSH